MQSHTEIFDLGPHDMIVQHRNPELGIELALAVHRIRNGRAIGGCRVRDYGSFDGAISDALRLSHAMSQKNLLAQVPFGGAKMVVNADPRTAKNPLMLHAIGDFVERFGGLYVTAPDSGISSDDLEAIAERTPWVVGFRRPAAAYTSAGVHVAIEATIEHLNGRRGLAGASVLVQGVGNVGSALVRRLREDGAHVYISDVDESRVRALSAETGATAVRPGSETAYEVDVFAPCGLGGVLTEEFSAALRARSVCGAANNQLADKGVVDLLRERGILYAPDFVANSGGVIAGAQEVIGFDEDSVTGAIHGISGTLHEIFERADSSGSSTVDVASSIARERLAQQD